MITSELQGEELTNVNNNDFEELMRSRIFDAIQEAEIKEKRASYDLMILRADKTIKDIMEYIKYEKNLIDQVLHAPCLIPNQYPKGLLDVLHAKIKRLYNIGLRVKIEDVLVWAEYLQFLKENKHVEDAVQVYNELLLHHDTNPGAWCEAANFEFHDNRNYENAKKKFTEGLSRHPDSLLLYEHYIRVEILQATLLQTPELIHKTDEHIDNATATYNIAKTKITDVDFFIRIGRIAHDNKPAKKLEDLILQDMETIFQENPLLWHEMAQRELFGIERTPAENPEYKELQKTDNPADEIPDTKPFKLRMEACRSVYKTGTEKIKNITMYSLALRTFRGLNVLPSVEGELKQSVLMETYRSAYNADVMDATEYIEYMKTLTLRKYKELVFDDIARRATTKYRDDPEIWRLWMVYHVKRYEDEAVVSIFRNGVAAVGLNSLRLWKVLLQYYQVRPDMQDRIEDVFIDAIQQPQCIADDFKSYFVEWLAMSKNINAGRQMFVQLVFNTEPCYEMHKTMNGLEEIQLEPNFDEWRKYHDITIAVFGDYIIDVWSQYVDFEMEHGNQANIDILRVKGKRALGGEEGELFAFHVDSLRKHSKMDITEIPSTSAGIGRAPRAIYGGRAQY